MAAQAAYKRLEQDQDGLPLAAAPLDAKLLCQSRSLICSSVDSTCIEAARLGSQPFGHAICTCSSFDHSRMDFFL